MKKRKDKTEITESMEFSTQSLGCSVVDLINLAKKLKVRIKQGNNKLTLSFTETGNKAQLVIETFMRTGIYPDLYDRFNEEQELASFTCGG